MWYADVSPEIDHTVRVRNALTRPVRKEALLPTKKLVRPVAVVATAVLALGMAACNRGDDGDADTKLVLAVSTLDNPFFITLRDGAKQAAKDADVDLEVVDAQDDATTQQDQLSNAVTQDADAILINPVDSDAAAAAVEPALDADIPVIAVDRSVKGKNVASTVSSDNVAGGQQAADALAEAVGDTAEVLQLQGEPGTSASRERGKGFSEGLRKHDGIDVAGKQPANFSRTKGLNVATNLLQSNSDVAGIFAENDEMALGAVKALGDRAGDDVAVVGFDGTDDALKSIKNGKMAATIAQQPGELGKTAVRLAAKAADGDDVPKQQPVEVKTVTKDNVEKFLQ